MRISVPDFQTIVKIYNENKCDISLIEAPLLGGQDYKENFHYSIFDKSYLEKILFQNGFYNVMEWDKNFDEFSSFDDWSNRGIEVFAKLYKISLNLQGQKKPR